VLALTTLLDEQALICPRCWSTVLRDGESWRCSDASCAYAEPGFPVVAGLPALVDFERSVLSAQALAATQGASLMARPQRPGLVKRMLHPANRQAPRLAARMLDLLLADAAAVGRRPRILVIGGGTVGDGLEALYDDERVDLLAFDVYASPHVQLVGDGHRIPLADGTVDGVIVQAVLEHVLEPTVVAGEIRRVLREGGVVYADTPFMQQVHEGPYDFTRFTESGHRYLFRDFEQLDSGQVAGAGTSLRWSINYFVRALTRSATLGRVAGLAFFWLSHLDRVLDPRHSLDGANSVYFLGRKGGRPMTPPQAVQRYQGGM
jgi:SAM-dependent methyltransferase